MIIRPLILLFVTTIAFAQTVVLCDVNKGFDLLSRPEYANAQIRMILEGCDTLQPDNPDVLLLHGLFTRKTAKSPKDYQQAIRWFEKAQQQAPQALRIQQELAATYLKIKAYAQAETLYQALLKDKPHDRDALLSLANVYRLEKKYPKAKALYHKLLTMFSADPEALTGLGWIQAAENQPAAARLSFQKVLLLDPNNAEAQKGLETINPLCDIGKAMRLLNAPDFSAASVQAIVQECDKSKSLNADTLLLKGLLARKTQKSGQDIQTTLYWLEQAVKKEKNNNILPNLELATTYLWAGQVAKALTEYNQILEKHPDNLHALTGKAFALRILKKFGDAKTLYSALLQQHRDAEYSNGLGWIALAEQDLNQAKRWFSQSLKIDPKNTGARKGLDDISLTLKAQAIAQRRALCNPEKGLAMLSEPEKHWRAIQNTLRHCDSYEPTAMPVLLLHGLVARYEAYDTGNYQTAISWLQRAGKVDQNPRQIALLELATTYEWSYRFEDALLVYDRILLRTPKNREALLGKARVLRGLYRLVDSTEIYHKLLAQNPHDIDALVGLGENQLVNYELQPARTTFSRALSLSPKNRSVLRDLQILNNATNQILEISGGDYRVPPQSSNGLNLYYFRNLNATDGLTVYATHNTKQIASNFAAGPTLLPNNSLLLGYQRIIPGKYNYVVSYDARQHNGLPFENWAFAKGGLYLNRTFEVFGGGRLAYPSPWNTELLISGLTVHTDWPVDVRVTGFWAQQQIEGYSSSYVVDLTKEFNNRFFYDIGTSYLYLPAQTSWEFHGRFIIPCFKNQAFVTSFSHFLFNNSSFVTAGWRFYWA